MRRDWSLLAIASLLLFASAPACADWPMAGGNPARTSWCAEEVSGHLDIEWYIPIEPYISQKVQVVAADGRIFLATSSGLYAFDAADGSTEWVFPTDVPLGHSPTVDNGAVYVGGFDRNLYAINADIGALIWKFTGGAGFQNNPVVVNGVVYVGCRDGKLHAIAAAGAANEGEEIWAQPFQAGGPILFSPAYTDGRLYIAANDACVYAVDAATGTQVWKSSKLPTGAFQSWWPVLTANYVLLYGADNYAINNRGNISAQFLRQQFRYDIFNDPDPPDASLNGEVPGVVVTPTPAWANGHTVYDFSLPNPVAPGAIAVTSEYFESKPWRRSFFVLDRSTGDEVSYDFDGDGNAEYAPIILAHTHGGSAHPPLVAPDGMIYSFCGYFHNGSYIPRGGLLGWKVDTPYIMSIGHDRAIDEPVAAAGGGNLIYNVLCCMRTGGSTSITGSGGGTYWGYSLYSTMPDLWDYYRLTSTDPTGPTITYGTHNGVYGLHADNNPPVPHNGKVYVHRMNHLLCLSSTGGRHKLPEATIQSASASEPTLSLNDLRTRLEIEIDKMIAAGHLKPGYFPMGLIDSTGAMAGDDLTDYFHDPGETIRVLCRALPHLPTAKQTALRSYIQSEFNAFPPYTYVHIGWNTGAKREAFDTPPEPQAFMDNFGPRTRWEWWAPNLACWHKPPQANYAMYKYAEVFGNASTMLTNQVDMFTDMPDNDFFDERPYILNAYIAGFYGLKGLYELDGQTPPAGVTNELNRLLTLRVTNWNKDRADISGTGTTPRYQQGYGIVWNLMYLVPELGQYLHDNLLSQAQTAMDEYQTVAPYWFVARAEEGYGEDGFALLQHYHAMMQTKAHILQEPFEELVKWVDIPAFEVGDLYYIDNLVSVIESGNRPKAKFSTVPDPAVGDAPLNVSFDASDSNDPDGTIVSYDWDFGDDSNSVGVTTNHQYVNQGVYAVTLTVTDNNGLSGLTIGNVFVTVNGDLPPIAKLTADPLSGVAPLDVSFDAADSYDPYGNIAAYVWDFNDGSPTGSGITTDHTFADPGVYQVMLTVTDDGGLTDANTVVITVDAPPPPIPSPGRLECEDYKLGGEGVGYHDTTPGNSGSATEYTDDIDIGNCADTGGGFNIGYIVPGEWAAYDVTVSRSGEYTATARVATDWAGTRTIRILLDGADVSGPISFTTVAGGGWSNYFDVSVGGLNLIEGDYEVRIQMESGDFNLNYVDIFLTGDINRDGGVDYLDLADLAQHWLWTGSPGDIIEDLVADGVVNLSDFTLLAAHWTVPYISVDINNDGSIDYHDLKGLGDNWLWSGIPAGIPEDIVVDGSVNLVDMARIASELPK